MSATLNMTKTTTRNAGILSTSTNESICGPKRHESTVDHGYPKSLAHIQQISSVTRHRPTPNPSVGVAHPSIWATVDSNLSHSLNFCAPQVPVWDHFGAKLA